MVLSVQVLKDVDTNLKAIQRLLHLPGLAVAIVHGDCTIYTREIGKASSDLLVTPDIPFVLGSLSKSFTALAIMQLVESGVLSLDDAVTQHLPWFHMADPYANQITICQLLIHTSGISRFAGRELLSHRHDVGLEETVRALKKMKLKGEPGNGFEYSNINYVILSLLVEIVSGVPYAQYIQEHIFQPLSMRHSHVYEDRARADGLAQGHRWWFGWPVPFEAPYLYDAQGAAFLISSARDLGRWLLLHLNGNVYGVSILSQAGIDKLHTPQGPTHKPGFQTAMGWRVGQLGVEEILLHSGEVSNYRSDMILIPHRQFGLVVLTNCNNGVVAQFGIDQIALNIARLLLGQPIPHRWLTPRSFFLLEAASSLALAGLEGWRWRQLGRSSILTTLGGLAALASDVIPPLLVLWRFPRLVEMPWSGMRLYAPDIARLLQWFSVLSLARAVVRMLRWLLFSSKVTISDPFRPLSL